MNPLESKIKNATKCFNRYKVETTNGLEHARYVVILKTNGDKGRVFFRGKKRSKELITVAIYGDNDSFDIVHFRYCRIHLSQHAANDYARLFTDRWRIDEKTRFIMEDNFYVDESIYVFIYTIRLMGKFYLHNISRLEMYRRVNKECHYLKIPHFTNRHKKPLVEKLKEYNKFSFVDDKFWERQLCQDRRRCMAEIDAAVAMMYMYYVEATQAYKERKRKREEEEKLSSLSAYNNNIGECSADIVDLSKKEQEGYHEKERHAEEPEQEHRSEAN